MTSDFSIHVPVMPAEVLTWLRPQPGQVLVDGTLGGGGHTKLLAELVGQEGLVIGVDRDTTAIERAARTLAGCPVQLVESDFCELPDVLERLGLPTVDGIVLDLGISSDQLLDQDRGFSFDAEGSLDLRFNTEEGEPAWQLVSRLDAEQLANIIYEFGEERYSRRIARKIVEQRRRSPIRTAKQLATLVRGCVPRGRGQRIDPATRTFQALRIAANGELSSLETALARIPTCLRLGGRVVVISFHSLEDRLVKTAFRNDQRYMALTKKPIRPKETEVDRNRRSRSARLRAAERC